MDDQGALEEADYLIRNKIVWVHAVRSQNGQEEIASLAAFTRTSENVSTITKVFTVSALYRVDDTRGDNPRPGLSLNATYC